MDQILLYLWLFAAVVLKTVDGIIGWLTSAGFSSGVLLFAIVTAGLFIGFNKWSVGIDLRLQTIERKLGIEHLPPKPTKITWWAPLFWFVAAAYLMGKSLSADGLPYFVVLATSGFMFLVCAFCTFYFLNQFMRDYFQRTNHLKKNRD